MNAMIGIAALLLLTGCAESLRDFRERDLTRAGTVAGQYATLAACTMDALERGERTAQPVPGLHPIYRHFNHAPAATASIVGTIMYPSGFLMSAPTPILELAMRQDGARVQIEARTRFRAGEVVERAAWPLIERCAGQAVAVSPALD